MTHSVDEKTARRTFGVGHLPLGYVKPPAIVNPVEWLGLAEKTLLSIPSVQNVEVNVGIDPRPWVLGDAGDPTPRLDSVIPAPLGASVKFDVTIPKRLHSSLHDGMVYPSELFRVVTRYGYFGPATFVIPLDGTDDGSSGVILVREFLKQEVSRRTDVLSVWTVGPSPYHVDFTIGGSSEIQEWEIEAIVHAGYNELNYTFPTTRYSSIDEAMDHLMDELESEFGLFYELKVRENRRRHSASDLMMETRTLIETHQRRGMRGTLNRLFRAGHAARTLGVLALQQKVAAERDAKWAAGSLDDIYAGGHPLSQQRAVLEKLARSDTESAVTSALDVVSFLEGSRSKEFEVAVIAAATLTGGVSGAVVALLAQ